MSLISSDARLRVAFDATPLLGQPTGIGVFARHVLSEHAIQRQLDLRAYALSVRGATGLASQLPATVKRVLAPLPASMLMRVWERSDQVRLDPLIGAVDVVHGTNFVAPPMAKRVAEVITVHDLTCVRFPELCTPAVLRFPKLIARALNRGAFVHTPTQAIADEVIAHFGADPQRVRAIHSGAENVPEVNADEAEAHAGVTFGYESGPAHVIDQSREHYMLALGTIEPRKDYVTLLRAFAEIAETHPNLHLVVAGARGWGSEAFDRALDETKLHDRVRVLGYVSDEERRRLLDGAAMLVFPSIYEGFGLPPLEAMAAGIPVVATDIPAVREVCGDAVAYAGVGDVAGMAFAISRMLHDWRQWMGFSSDGVQRVQRFQWAQTAKSLAQFYADASTDRRS